MVPARRSTIITSSLLDLMRSRTSLALDLKRPRFKVKIAKGLKTSLQIRKKTIQIGFDQKVEIRYTNYHENNQGTSAYVDNPF